MLNNTWYIYSLSSPVFFSLCSPLCLWHSPHSPLFLSCLPAPTSIPLSLFLCAHITVVVTSHCVFLSLHDCSYPPPNTLLLPKAQPCPVTTLTSSLDTVLALTLSFHTVLLLPLDMGASNVNLDGHINGQTSTEYTHTPCLHKCQLYWLCCLPSWKTVSVIWPNDRVLEVAVYFVSCCISLLPPHLPCDWLTMADVTRPSGSTRRASPSFWQGSKKSGASQKALIMK